MQVENNTPFAADRYAVADRDGTDLLLVILKGTYLFDNHGELGIAADQCPIALVDQYTGEPGLSSITYASDFSINKTATDVAVLGHAYPVRPRDVSVNAGIQVGPVEKLVKVFGDRTWSRSLGIARISSPEPFERIPLLFERAFGGSDKSHPDEKHHEYEARNPAGVGFRARKSKQALEDMPLPNIEDPKSLISGPDDRPAPANLGFIGPSWQPRLSYAGTYDESWDSKRKPLLPEDFDNRFFNASHPDLVCQGFLKGNEEVNAIGVSPNGPISLTLPGITPQCVVEDRSAGEHTLLVRLDKVVLEPDERRLLLVWSGTYRVSGALQNVEGIRLNAAEQG